AGFLQCVLQNKEAFCRDVLPVYETKIAELDDQIRLLARIKSNLEDRVRSIMEEQGRSSPVRMKGELRNGGNHDDG
ncbi:MAG: MerR family transcriptional regulator, partial [Paenibacillus sp.]|nr:MerR family transcriptional regulator [Paenibacillus sp.]